MDYCYVSLYQRPNRPQVLLHALSNPKEWKEKFVFIKEVGPSRPFWVRESDDHVKFSFSWRKPRYGVFEGDWEDLTVEEHLAVLQLITTDPLDLKRML